MCLVVVEVHRIGDDAHPVSVILGLDVLEDDIAIGMATLETEGRNTNMRGCMTHVLMNVCIYLK